MVIMGCTGLKYWPDEDDFSYKVFTKSIKDIRTMLFCNKRYVLEDRFPVPHCTKCIAGTYVYALQAQISGVFSGLKRFIE